MTKMNEIRRHQEVTKLDRLPLTLSANPCSNRYIRHLQYHYYSFLTEKCIESLSHSHLELSILHTASGRGSLHMSKEP